MSHIVISVEGISKSYRLGTAPRPKMLRDRMSQLWSRQSRTAKRNELFWALKDVSFEIKRGEVVGIIGRNGAGKSTLLKVLSRITEPTLGKATVRGRIGSLLEVGTGFHPELSGRENVFLNGAILGLSKSDIQRRFDDIVAFAEVAKFIDTPVKHYSSGMYLRLAFAVAAHLEAQILLVDEVLAVGDIGFQQKCLGKMNDVANEGRTVLFVSHNMPAVRSLCTKGILLDGGAVKLNGAITDCVEAYMGSAEANDQDDHVQSGFGPLRVNGQFSPTIMQSESFDIESTFMLDEDTAGVSFYTILEDINGRTVLHVRKDAGEHVLGHSRSLSIRVQLPALWLNPGPYALHLKALPWGTNIKARYRSERLLLDISGASSSIPAMLNPRTQWSFEKSEISNESFRTEVVVK